MKKLLQSYLRKFGVDVLSLSYSREYIYEHHLAEMLERYAIKTVIDVGANIGGYGQLLRRIGFKGRIISFEPVSEPYEKLSALASKDPLWETFPCALGQRHETKAINVMAGSELCSFLAPNESSQKMTVVSKREIEVRTLDSVANIDWSTTFVKLDTQGHDVAVMTGAREVLQKTVMLQSELSFLPIYREMPDFSQALQLMRELGFDVTGFFPVSRDAHRRVKEFDCLAVNRNLLPPARWPQMPVGGVFPKQA